MPADTHPYAPLVLDYFRARPGNERTEATLRAIVAHVGAVNALTTEDQAQLLLSLKVWMLQRGMLNLDTATPGL